MDQLGRRVFVEGDLFEHDLALGLEVGERAAARPCRPSPRTPRRDGRRESARDDGVVLRGRGVELAAHLVEDARDVPGAVALRALEDQVFDEDARRPLAPASRVANRRGSRTRARSSARRRCARLTTRRSVVERRDSDSLDRGLRASIRPGLAAASSGLSAMRPRALSISTTSTVTTVALLDDVLDLVDALALTQPARCGSGRRRPS